MKSCGREQEPSTQPNLRANYILSFVDRQAKEDASELIAQSKELDADIKRQEEEEKECKLAVDKAIVPIGNLVHDSVPIDNDEVRAERLFAIRDPVLSACRKRCSYCRIQWD
jgi:seryl-tRNA synthetase